MKTTCGILQPMYNRKFIFLFAAASAVLTYIYYIWFQVYSTTVIVIWSQSLTLGVPLLIENFEKYEKFENFENF